MTAASRALIAAALLAACGDNQPGATPEPDAGLECPAIVGRDADADFGSPDDFAVEGCVAGGMADFDLEGLYFLEGVENFIAGGMIRFTESCGELTTFGHEHVEATADHVYWSQPDVATYLCRAADGAIIGRSASCYGGECFAADIRAVPFGLLDEPAATGFELLGEYTPPAELAADGLVGVDVRVAGGVAYLVMRKGIVLIDVSDPRAPRQLAVVAAPHDYFNDLDLYTGADGRRYALATGSLYNVWLDVTDPTAPREVRRMALDGGHCVFTETRAGATTAYLAGGWNDTIRMLDVSDPAGVAPLGAFPDESGFHDLQVVDGIGYLNAAFSGFAVVDLSDPAAAAALGRMPDMGYSHATAVTTAGGRRVAVVGDEGLGSYLRVVDVDPVSADFMKVIGERRMRREVSAHNIVAIGERIYVSWYQHGLRVLDLGDPTAPVEVGHFNTWRPEDSRGEFFEGALGVDVDPASGVVFIADSLRGLLILGPT